MPPRHPGEILKEMYLEPMNITITQVAESLNVARRTVSLIINGHSGISAEMALRLAKAFDTTPELWLNTQRSYDLWNAGNKIKLTNVKHLVSVKRQSAKLPHKSIN